MSSKDKKKIAYVDGVRHDGRDDKTKTKQDIFSSNSVQGIYGSR